jgi:putative oxidoreductase
MLRWFHKKRRHIWEEDNMAEMQAEPKLLLPGLKPLYDAVIPLSWLVVRVAVGWNLVVHGWGKLMIGPTPGFLKAYVDLGFDPPLPWFWGAFGIEFIGGIALILGLFTRFFAAAAAIEMLFIFFCYWSHGFAWLKAGYEYVLLWGLISFAIALRGGGPYSLDRWLGKEL